MDDGERRSSQYGQQYQTPTSGRPAPGQPMGPPTETRYSQSAQSPARSNSGRQYMTGYPYTYQDAQYQTSPLHSSSPMQGVELQYGSTYAQEPSGRQQMQASPTQHSQYSPYGQSSMMNPASQQSMYEGMQQYQQQRQAAALEVIAGQFGSMPSYIQSSDPGSGNVAGGGQYGLHQSEPQSYGGMTMSRPQLQAPFQAVEYQTSLQPEVRTAGDEQTSAETIESGRRQYEEQLRATFTSIATGRVTEAANSLLSLTRWLLPSVRDLGLHHDDATQYEQRLSFWREFNHAWEALGLRQKRITEEAQRTRQQPIDILSATIITNLIDELVRLCDQIEKFGLVDYELGVWEEQIVGIFTQCLDLIQTESEEGDVPTASAQRS